MIWNAIKSIKDRKLQLGKDVSIKQRKGVNCYYLKSLNLVYWITAHEGFTRKSQLHKIHKSSCLDSNRKHANKLQSCQENKQNKISYEWAAKKQTNHLPWCFLITCNL